MSHRLQVVLPDPLAATLRELAHGADEPPATLAARLLRHAITRVAQNGKHPPPKNTTILTRRREQRPPWLEPYGADRDWHALMWGAIVALHGRYPRHLDNLKDGWWHDQAHTEILSALAVWRAAIDEGAEDPREELAFHHQLDDYAQVLNKLGGSVTQVWKPGPPHEEWGRTQPHSRR